MRIEIGCWPFPRANGKTIDPGSKQVRAVRTVQVLAFLRAFIGLWCNGSTTDFGSASPGSNPGSSANVIIIVKDLIVIKKIVLILIVMICGVTCYADNDSIMTEISKRGRVIIGDGLEPTPASEVYEDWNNYNIHTKVVYPPKEYDIDLSDYHSPLHNKREIISPYGKRVARNHNGTDIRASLADTVYAAFDGKVRFAAYNAGGYGFLVVIRHHNGLETYYAHLSRIGVMPNEEVCAGQAIGMAGTTGRSSCVHLHFETRFCGRPIDPQDMFKIKEGVPLSDNYKFVKKK